MSSTDYDSHSPPPPVKVEQSPESHSPPPPVKVEQSPESVLENKDDEEIEESVEHEKFENKNAQEGEETSVTLTKFDLLGFENDTPVKGGATGGGNSNEVVPISPDQIQSGVDENQYEIIYSFPPDLNINGRLGFELVTVRENRRLQIFMVPYRWPPQLVRSPLRNGRLRMWLLSDDQYGGAGEQVSPLQSRREEDDRIVE